MSLQTDAKAFSVEIQKKQTSDAKAFSLEIQKKQTFLTPDYEIKHEEKITVVEPQGGLEQFLERQQLLLTPFEYPRNGQYPGLVLIFNQESFEDKTYRLGSRRDVNEIIICMSRLGFNINEEYIFTDYSRAEILSEVHKIANQDLSQFNSLIVFFLTHGDSFNLLHATDVSLDASDIWKEFVDCKHLKDKPKMFIFQACKGDDHSTTTDEALIHKKIDLVPDKTFNSNYIGPDMLVVYSTAEGNVSFRDPKTGTWFIQELCKNFLAYGRRDDVISLITRTTKCLCGNYYHVDHDKIKKQMPVFVSTLKKKFYLNRTKDRNLLIKVVQDQESMQERINDLDAKVSKLLQDKEKRNK